MDQSLQRRGVPLATLGLALAAAGLANTANAACTDPGWLHQLSTAPGFISTVYNRASDRAWAMTVSDESPSIVGLWSDGGSDR